MGSLFRESDWFTLPPCTSVISRRGAFGEPGRSRRRTPRSCPVACSLCRRVVQPSPTAHCCPRAHDLDDFCARASRRWPWASGRASELQPPLQLPSLPPRPRACRRLRSARSSPGRPPTPSSTPCSRCAAVSPKLLACARANPTDASRSASTYGGADASQATPVARPTSPASVAPAQKQSKPPRPAPGLLAPEAFLGLKRKAEKAAAPPPSKRAKKAAPVAAPPAPVSAASDDEESDAEDDDDGDAAPVVHESLLPGYAESEAAKGTKRARAAANEEDPAMRNARTVFVGNVPTACALSKVR